MTLTNVVVTCNAQRNSKKKKIFFGACRKDKNYFFHHSSMNARHFHSKLDRIWNTNSEKRAIPNLLMHFFYFCINSIAGLCCSIT